ncbi:MAG: PD-(D/E)XK nuclease family protein, partial [Omnitrophica bacterium]|nr:PD-(D/E)XK nuclease family protein [Candidatus Omnitrophota bacterium]
MKIAKKPFYTLEKDGLTQSLLSMFLMCRQKAKLYLKGWNSKWMSDALMYGSLGHGILELAYLDIAAKRLKGTPSERQSRKYADRVEKQWLKENPKTDTKALLQLDIFLAILEKMLPHYFDFWSNDFKKIRWEALEEQFDVVAKPMPGLAIRTRGKQDGRFILRNELWLFETKTKSLVNEANLIDTLSLDLQVNLYLWAAYKKFSKTPTGMLYNIIRKTTLRINKTEPVPKFAKRVVQDMDDRPEFYFMRLEIPTSKEDILAFEKDFFGL